MLQAPGRRQIHRAGLRGDRFLGSRSSMLVLLLVALLGGVHGAVDLTVTDRATGSAVVNAVVDFITQSCVFDNDRLTLRRIAYAETRDGAAGFTSTRGGIWQVCLSTKICLDMIANSFLGERCYVTFGLWHEPSVCRLWSVCRLSSVTLLHPR